MRLSQFEVITDEDLFLSVNRSRSNGHPDSWETRQAKERLRKYREAKGEAVPGEIMKEVIETINRL